MCCLRFLVCQNVLSQMSHGNFMNTLQMNLVKLKTLQHILEIRENLKITNVTFVTNNFTLTILIWDW